jgi:hypothetical protein
MVADPAVRARGCADRPLCDAACMFRFGHEGMTSRAQLASHSGRDPGGLGIYDSAKNGGATAIPSVPELAVMGHCDGTALTLIRPRDFIISGAPAQDVQNVTT